MADAKPSSPGQKVNVAPSAVVSKGNVKRDSRGVKYREDKLQNGKVITTYLAPDAGEEKSK